MTAKNAYILIISAIVLSSISLAILFIQNAFLFSYNSQIGKTILDNFAESDIKEINFIKPGGRSVKLIRSSDGQWSVGNYFNYPSDKEKVNNFLQDLSSLKAIQAVNIKPSQLRALRLLPPSDKDKNSGTEIRIIGADKQIIYSLIAGARRIDSLGASNITRGRYILMSGSKVPVLTEESLSETKYSSKEFLSSNFVTIKDIKKLQLTKGKDIIIWTILKKDQNAEFELYDKKEDDPDINIDNIYSVVSSLESLKFDSVANPSAALETTGLDKPYALSVETFGGDSFIINIGKQFNNYRYIKIDSSSFPLGKNWIYLIDNSRITPFLQTKKDLSSKKRKLQGAPDKIYSKPIG